jgi:hypothetical protein
MTTGIGEDSVPLNLGRVGKSEGWKGLTKVEMLGKKKKKMGKSQGLRGDSSHLYEDQG